MTDQLGPDFDARLRAELDRLDGPTPLPSSARYSQPRTGYRPFGGMRPTLVVAGAVAVLLVAASAVSGSPDPAVWVTTVENVTHVGPASASPSPVTSPNTQANPTSRAEPSEAVEPSHESPEPSGGDTHSQPVASPEASATPSPEPAETPSPGSDGEHSGSESPAPLPSPSPSDSHSDS
jgi:hypothetical protein